MSGVGVGSKEMRSVLVDNSQLLPLQIMLNDLKTKLGYMTSYCNSLQYTYVGPIEVRS
jgi:hypothetical protein